MKTALIEWLGGDPIEEYLRQAVMLKDGLRDLNRKITAAPPPILPPTTNTSV